MTTGAIIVLVLGVFATIAFALYAANHREDDSDAHTKTKHHNHA
jgi:hypothetical protein